MTSVAALTIVVLIVVASVAGFSSPRWLDRAVLRPYLIAHGSGYDRVFTSGFVHAGVGHLLFNLITLYSFGFALERVIGTTSFVALYLCALVTSGIGTVIKHRGDPNYRSLGASGAILGVLFASIVYFPHSRLMMMFIPIPIPAPLFAVGYLALSYYWSRTSRDNVNHDAHIFGALTGLAYVAVTDPRAVEGLIHYLTG